MFYLSTLSHWFNRTVAIQGASGWEPLGASDRTISSR